MRRTHILGLTNAFLAMTAIWVGAAAADNWPSWRGPENKGISKEKHFPLEWSETKNIAWKVPLPNISGSTPCVWDGHIFLTSPKGGNVFLLHISKEGKILWERPIGATGHMKAKQGEPNESASSPSTDGKYVYALGSSGDLTCFDFDGNKIWSFNIEDRYGVYSIFHGIQTSPLLDEDRIYLALLHSNAHWVVALDKNSGKEIWRYHRVTDAKDESAQAYTTPMIWHMGDEKQLVVVGCDYATGHNLENGKEIWRVGDLNPKSNYSGSFRIIATPVVDENIALVSTARDNGPIVAIKPGVQGTVAANGTGESWRAKGAPDVSSPLLVDGLAYFMQSNGVLLCLDAKNGKEVYKERITKSAYRASPVFADGRIYLTARDNGTVSALQAGRKFEILATNELDDKFASSPALADGRIYLRGYKNLYAIEDKSK